MASLTPRIDSHARNLVINGNFDFWQRGTSFASANSYTADRWTVYQGGYTGTVTRSTDVPTQVQSGFNSQYSLLFTNGTGAAPTSNQYQQVGYRIEGYDYQMLHARRARLQIWMKCSLVGTYPLALLNASGTRSYVATYTITSANTWQKVTLDPIFDSIGTWLFDNSLGCQIIFPLTSGATFQTSTTNVWTSSNAQGLTGQTQWGATTGATFQIAQFMIIPEDLSGQPTLVDIPFQRAGRTIQQEIALAQRYYESNYDIGTTVGSAVSAQSGEYVIPFNTYPHAQRLVAFFYKVPKRIKPSVNFWSLSGTSGKYSNSTPTNSTDLATSNEGDTTFGTLTSNGGATTTGYVIFAMWAADAEL